MADKVGTERKVWVLPAELSDRIKLYQASQGIASEVEAARRLLDTALQMRDGVEDILNKLRERFRIEKDFRVLARDVLATHPLVEEIQIREAYLQFKLRSEIYGQITVAGEIYSGTEPGYLSQHREEPKREVKPAKPASLSDSWERSGDLDDEIPF